MYGVEEQGPPMSNTKIPKNALYISVTYISSLPLRWIESATESASNTDFGTSGSGGDGHK